MRWLLTGCLLLASGSVLAQEGGVTTPPLPGVQIGKAIPIQAGAVTDTPQYFQATINPPATTRAPGATGALADSASQYVDFGWFLPMFSMFTIGYDTGINAFRQDQIIWDEDSATSQVTTTVSNKVSLTAKWGEKLKATGFVQVQRSATGGTSAYTDAARYGTEVVLQPFKDVTTVKAEASERETYNIDGSLLNERLCTGSLEQKLPWAPFTLRTAGSVTRDSAPLLAASDKEARIIDASLLWKLTPAASLSGGVQQQAVDFPATLTLEETNICFGQLALQPAKSWTVTLRAAHEAKGATDALQRVSRSGDVMLSVGLAWSLSDRFNAAAGLNYRALPSQSPAASAQATPPPASVSISAGGNF